MFRNSFFSIINSELGIKRMTGADLYRLLQEEDVSISQRSIQRYLNSEMVPRFEVAAKIYAVLELEYTKEDLEYHLAVAKEQLSKPENIKYIQRSVRIPIRKIVDGAKREQLTAVSLLLDERIQETQGLTRNNFNAYVTALIREDLQHHILPTIIKKETKK